MWPLASAFFDVAIHRRGPEDLPASRFLVALLLPPYLLSAVAQLAIGVDAGGAEVAFVIADACAYLVFVWFVLSLFKKPARFRQTATAVLGTAIWLNVLSLPLLLWHDSLTSGEPEATLPLFGYLALFIWSIDVRGYVLARALEQPYMVGVLIVVLYVMTSMSVSSALSII